MAVPWSVTRRRRAGQSGQVLVIFALALVALMGAAGLAFDVGRFYSEKRFLQNAADAGALAVANALIRGESNVDAEAEGRDVIARNLLTSPTGSTGVVAASPVYETGHAGSPAHLVSGILISGMDVRVAIQSQVTYTFGRALGFETNLVGGRARVRAAGDLLPIAIRHYVNASGPYDPIAPCPDGETTFRDLISTANTACLGSVSDASLRTAPSPGLAFDPSAPGNDPVNHGPIISLVGKGASPSNAASFRGAVVLDIRNFYTTTSNVFYNGVTAGSAPNTLKEQQAKWVAKGYPGPAFPPATIPADPNDQVGILDGNNTGVIVDAIRERFGPGDEFVGAVYSGTVMKIPDFQLQPPATVTIGTTESRPNSVAVPIIKNSDFLGQVYTTVFANWEPLATRVDPADPVDPDHPLTTGTLLPITVSPSPATPPTTVRWSTFETVAAPIGIHTVWVKGHSPSPYLTDHYYPVGVAVGGVVRDFSAPTGGLLVTTPTTGTTATGTIDISTPNKNDTYFGGTINASIEGGPQAAGSLPAGLGATSVSPASFSLNKGDQATLSVSINPGTLGPGEYELSLRLEGQNLLGQPVTRMVPVKLLVATAGTSNEYVDIVGFAVFRITDVPSSSNSSPNNAILGYAISGVYADMNDPALRRGQVARLAPWN